MREHVLRLRVAEERRVVAERAEAKAPPVRGRRGDHRRAGQPQRPQPPEEDRDVRDVVAAAPARDPAHVDGVRERRPLGEALERPAELLEARGVADRQEARALRPQVVQVLGRREQLEGLVGPGGQAGDVARELLQHRGRALAAPVRDRVRHLAPRAERLAGQAGDAEQVADVGEHPRRARLDELVVVEPSQALLEHRRLVADHVEQLGERPPLLLVADAVDRGEQLGQALGGRRAHGRTTTSPGRRSRTSSSAPRAASASSPGRGEAAGRNDSKPGVGPR